MESSLALRRDHRLAMHFVLSDQDMPVRIGDARVCWATENRFGAEFLVVSDEARQRLSRFLRIRFEAGLVAELRRHPRFAVQIPVAFWSDDAEGQGNVLNISLGGCAVESDIVPTTGTFLHLSLLLLDDRSSLIIDLAAVRRSGHRTFSVEFIQMQPDAETILRRFLARFPPDGV